MRVLGCVIGQEGEFVAKTAVPGITGFPVRGGEAPVQAAGGAMGAGPRHWRAAHPCPRTSSPPTTPGSTPRTSSAQEAAAGARGRPNRDRELSSAGGQRHQQRPGTAPRSAGAGSHRLPLEINSLKGEPEASREDSDFSTTATLAAAAEFCYFQMCSGCQNITADTELMIKVNSMS